MAASMVALFALVSIAPVARAAGEGGGGGALRNWGTDPVLEQMQTFTARKDWQGGGGPT